MSHYLLVLLGQGPARSGPMRHRVLRYFCVAAAQRNFDKATGRRRLVSVVVDKTEGTTKRLLIDEAGF